MPSIRCKVVEVEQGSETWDGLRRGRLTASRMGDVMAKPTTKRYQDYQQQIVFELLGHDEPEESAQWFEHGRAMEPYARGAFQWKYGIELTADVFCIHADHDWLACSPDGLSLPDYDMAVEIKCRLKYRTYVDKVSRCERTGKIDATYRPQVQAQLWVMGLPSLRFVEYYHDAEQRVRKMHVTEVQRDDAYIDKMEERALQFMVECYRLADKDIRSIAA